MARAPVLRDAVITMAFSHRHVVTMARKMAPWPRHVLTAHPAEAQAHPPAAGGQPLPLFAQHQAFLGTDQPAIQLANPASQSYGSEEVTHPPPWFGQPFPCTLQHHSFLATDQPACQFENPSLQLNGSAGRGG